MKRILFICSTLIFTIAVSVYTASAQEFNLELSVNIPFSASGLSTDQATLSAAGLTSLSDIDLSAKADFMLTGLVEANLSAETAMEDMELSATATVTPSGFDGAKITAETAMDDVEVEAEVNLGADGFSDASFTLSSQYDAFNISGEFNLNAEGFDDATFSASTANEEGGSLSTAVTFNATGIAREVITVGVRVSGFSLARTSIISANGLSERWQAGARFGNVQITRLTNFGPEGFVNDVFSLTTKVNDLDVKKTMIFSPAGFASADIEIGGRMDSITFASKTHLNPDMSWEETLTLMTAVDQLNLALAAVVNPAGFQGGGLNAGTSFTFNEAPEPETPEESDETPDSEE